ncbi:MAG: flagellar type III secretion system pore protein FliP, partial [bacterium]
PAGPIYGRRDNMTIKNLINLTLLFFFLNASLVFAAPQAPLPNVFDVGQTLNSPQFSTNIQLLISLAMISLAPFILICVTSFMRIIIVLSMVRVAVGTQQVPPNSVIIGLALFLTVFIMAPVWQQIDKTAVQPYNKGRISQAKAFDIGQQPLREFMFKQTREDDLSLFIKFSKIEKPRKPAEVPTFVLIPSFMLSELKTSFQIGFTLFVPFLIIDLVVANILLSLGMFMLSPVIVSLPFKILLFVLADGWRLIVQGLLLSFH